MPRRILMKYSRAQKLMLAFIAALLIGSPAIAQTADQMREAAKFERQAGVDYKAKDFPKFLENIKNASELRPNHARLLYNLAVGYSQNGKTDEALAVLERLAAMDVFFEVEKDEDFKPLFEMPRFKKIQSALADNLKPKGDAVRAFGLTQKDLLTEGIAIDVVSKRYFVSSVHQRKIVAIDSKGKATDFSSANDGLWGVSGMRVDEKRRILWVTTTAFPQMRGFAKADEGKSGVFKYDLRSGKLVGKFLLSNEQGKHALGDLIVAKNGDVFASDSIAPNIYRITAKSSEPEVFVTSENFASLQGLAFSPDEKTLFAADYSKGIFRISMKDKAVSQIKFDANSNPIGIDGIYFHRGSLIAIQNGFRPHRVARFTLDASLTAIVKSETLVANHTDFDEPTLGVLVGSDFVFIANSQWNFFGEDGKVATDKLKEPVVLKIRL